jgi:hypothetical protein
MDIVPLSAVISLLSRHHTGNRLRSWELVSQRAMQSYLIIVLPPLLNQDLSGESSGIMREFITNQVLIGSVSGGVFQKIGEASRAGLELETPTRS